MWNVAKIYFIKSTSIQYCKVIWSTKVNCMVHPMIFIPHCECLYFYTMKLVIIKRNEEHLFLPIAPFLRLFHVRTQTISRPSKSMPRHIHTCSISLAWFIHRRSLYLKRKHDTITRLHNTLTTVTIYVLWLLYSHRLTVELCICWRHDYLTS